MMNLQEAGMGDGQPKNDRSASKFSLSRRQKQYWGSLAVAAVLGLLMGWFLDSTGSFGKDSGNIFDISSSIIPENLAIFGSALYLISFAIIYTLYHKGMDEQEERAYLIANTASWYFLILAIPIWWVLDRADIAPPIDGITIAIVSFVINISVWAWKKFL
jgi:hypothetical protein